MQTHAWLIAGIITATNFVHAYFVSGDLIEYYKIEKFPGQPNGSFQQYAGYIYVDSARTRALFFYFVEAESHPGSKPLVLWLNGGPGCSSVGVGAFSEHGPFKAKGDILLKNEYNWNKEANVLYLESPAGVGFSYSTDKSFYTGVNDKKTSHDSLVFLSRWFMIFDKYKKNDFYIAGESYGGHYVPQLAKLIVKEKPSYKLKGISIGNPLLEFTTDMNAHDDFFWSHGLISDSVYNLLQRVCNSSRFFREYFRNKDEVSDACAATFHLALEQIGASVNQYDVTADVCSSGPSQQDMLILRPKAQKLLPFRSESDDINAQKVGVDIDVCVQDEATKYLNRKDVQKALNAKLVGVSSWNLCRFWNMKKQTERYRQLAFWVGWLSLALGFWFTDQDSVIPFLGTRTLVSQLAKESKMEVTAPYRTWFEGKQVAGWTQSYAADKLTYDTIRGASHDAPATQPERSFLLFKSYLAGKPLPKK